jgi:hypothetical protein
MGIRWAGMGGVCGTLREPKSMLIYPPWPIFYKATISTPFFNIFVISVRVY